MILGPDWTEPWSRVSLLANSTDIIPDYLRKTSFRDSAGRVPSVDFSQTLRSIGVVGTRNSIVSVLGTWPPSLLSSCWVPEWFDNVDSRLRLRVSTMRDENFSDALHPLILSICATNTEEDSFHPTEALAGEYFLPYAGASAEWKEMVRIYHKRTADEVEDQHFDIKIRITQMLDGRKVFIVDNGYCGLVPDHTEEGDMICVLFGCDVPVVLRQKADHYIFIGKCYVRGLVYGEAIEALERGNTNAERFEIF
jgi:hypothetical protein